MTLNMAVAGTAPKIKKNASRKNKKSWRKNVDMSEVEEYLEEKRFEERIGGCIADRPDSELFVLDTTIPSPGIKKKNRKEIKPLRCFANLSGLPGAADPVGQRDRVRTAEERMNPIVKAKLASLAKAGIVGQKARQAQRNRDMHHQRRKETELERTTRRRTKFDFDLWGSEEPAVAAAVPGLAKDWMEPDTVVHTATGLSSYKPKETSKRKPTTGSLLPAVELPHPGASYNPSLADHNDLLWKATLVELEKEKEVARIERATTLMFPTAAEAPTMRTYIQEMSEGIVELEGGGQEKLPTDNEEASAQHEDSEPAEGRKLPKAKTRKQKRDKKKALFEKVKQDSKLKDKLKENDIFRLRSFKKEIREQEAKTAERLKKKEAKAREKQLAPIQLSNYKYEAPDIEVKLSDELTGNLRNLKPEGSLLEDRYKSLQRRNIIETRIKQKVVKRLKRKRVEKRSYKMGFEETQLKKKKKIKKQRAG